MLFIPGAQGFPFPEGNSDADRAMGEGGGAPGVVFEHGTFEEDGPVTWETLISPRDTPVLRGAGHPSPCTVRVRGRRPLRGRAERLREE